MFYTNNSNELNKYTNMNSLLFIISLLVGSFTFSTLLYIYFAYTSQPDPEEELIFQSFKNESLSASHLSVESSMEEKVA